MPVLSILSIYLHFYLKVKLLSRIQLFATQQTVLPGSSVHGIFQARVLEWGAIAFSYILPYVVLNMLDISLSSHVTI